MISRAIAVIFCIFLSLALSILPSKGISENTLKRLSTDISDVKELITGGYVYVDKTGFVLRLVHSPDTFFILARPRRFGKTTFLSTLAEIFDGNQDLFNGTAIRRLQYDWPRHPVIRIDFSDGTIACDSADAFRESVIGALKAIATTHEISDLEGETVKDYVVDLMSALHDKLGSRIVVLVDEYDHPYLSNYERPEVASKNLKLMRTFYAALYSMSENIHLCFVTGVTKLGRSGMGEWADITLDSDYAEIAGFTQQEVELYFAGHIESVVEHKNTTREHVLDELKSRYEGYRFSRNKMSVYNSFTVISYFISKEGRNFWTEAESANVRGLLERIAEHPVSALSYLQGMKTHPMLYVQSNCYDKDKDDEGLNLLESLLLQAGYLTIVKYDAKRDAYKLGLANREIHDAFFNSLLVAFGGTKYSELYQTAYGVQEDLEKLRLNEFFEKVNTYIATFLSNSTVEGDKLSLHLHRTRKITNGMFNIIFRSVLLISGIKINPEGPSNLVTFHLAKILYLFQLRLAEDPIDECIRLYVERYQRLNLRSVCVGVKFDTKTTRIVDWEAAEYSEAGEEQKRIYADTW